ncbi:cytochrome P450 family protein [Nocardiopsis nanhaiensis]
MPCPVSQAESSDDITVIHPVIDSMPAERERLYQAGPVARVQLPGGVQAWATTHHDVTRATLNDSRLVKNAEHWADLRAGLIPEGWPLLLTVPMGDNEMLGLDGAPHRRLRNHIAKPFSARRVERLRPRIEQITADTLDRLEPKADQTLDLKSEFTFPIPVGVVGELYGVDPRHYPYLGELCNALFDSTSTPQQFQETYGALQDFFADVVAAKKADPGEDMTTDLFGEGPDGDRLSDIEVERLLLNVMVAGHETTVNLLNCAVRALLNHPEQLELAKKGEIGWDAVVEETLRYDTPNISMLFRFATEDIEIGGVTIRKGEALMTHYGAVTVDREEYGEDVHVFDPTRAKGRHIAFGYGPHVCPGAPLSRLEAGVILPMLFERFPDMTLAVADEDLELNPSLLVNSLKELPVVLRL